MNQTHKLSLLNILIWFSSFMIVIYHYVLWFNIDYYENNFILNYLVKKKEYGANFVYLYWSISGYIFISTYFYKKNIILKNFATNIFAKYYPLHLLTLITVFIIQYISIQLYGKTQFDFENDWYHFVLHLFFASDWGFQNNFGFNAPIWFMSTLIPIFLFFFLTFKYLKKFKYFFSIFIMIFFYYLIPYLFENFLYKFVDLSKWSKQAIFNFKACFFYFYLGTIVFLFCELNKKYKTIFIFLSILGILLSIFTLNYDTGLFSEYFNFIPATVLLFTSLLVLCQSLYIDLDKSFNKIKTLTDTSYSIYLWHFPLQLVYIITFSYFDISSDLFKNLSNFLIYIIILLIISIISSKNFEKPCKKFIENYEN